MLCGILINNQFWCSFLALFRYFFGFRYFWGEATCSSPDVVAVSSANRACFVAFWLTTSFGAAFWPFSGISLALDTFGGEATFQWLMQNCLGKLNLIPCRIYLDDLIMFLQTVEEHLHRLHIVFDWLREYNLKLKPSKCSLFKEEINYLACWVSKQGVQPSDANLKAIAECVLPWTYMEIHAFLGLIGHYRWFIKGFIQIASHWMNTWLGREPVESWSRCCFWKMP